jgi:hypothetical protein
MQINLIPDTSVSSAPVGFTAAIQAAANVYDQDFAGNYTVNINYGWGTFNGQASSGLTNPNSGDFALGGEVNSTEVSYATLKSWLTANALLNDQKAALASLPAGNAAFPGATNSFFVSSAQEKAFGEFTGSGSAIDGAIGFNIGDTANPSYWETAALCEIGHALGWMTDHYVGAPTILDLFRYSSAGQYQWTGGDPAYFSIDGGTTPLATFSSTFDYTLFTNVASNDPFNVAGDTILAQGLTSLDIEVMNVIGFTTDGGPVETVSNLTALHGQSYNASSLFTYGDPLGSAATEYDFWDTGNGGGHFLLNATPLGANQDNIITPAQLSQLTYQSGSGADTLWVRANDGTQWGPWSNAFTVTAPIDTGAFVTLTSSNVIVGQSPIAASSLFTAGDTDGDTVTQYDFWNLGTGGGRFLVNGVAQGTNRQIIVSAAQLSQVSYQAGSAPDMLWVQANDGYVWGVWSSPFTLSPWVPVTVLKVTATHGQSFAASSLFTASDPDGDTITQYDFWDTGTGGGHFVLNGTALGANQDNYVTAAQLMQATYQSGSGADTLWVRANDGTQWSPWSNSFTVTAPVDRGPVVTPASSNTSATHNQSFAASPLSTYSDPFSDPAIEYDFWDTGSGGGHFVLNGTALGANQDNYVTDAQLMQATYQSGSGADTLWVRANDGTQWSPWSNSFTVTAPVDTGSVVTPASSNTSATHNQSFTASSLFTYSDPFSDPATLYDFWDMGAGGGDFVLNGTVLGANQDNYVTAAQLAQTSYQSGSGADTLWVRAYDGTQWSAWSSAFTVTAPIDTGPVVTPASSNTSATHNQSFAASSLFTYFDPFGDPATQYDFWDTGAGGGHFVLNGTALGTKQDNFVSAAQLPQLSYQSGSGPDTLWVRANDGTQWSAWSSAFTVTAPIDTGPVVTSVSSITTVAGQTFAASSLFTATDPFNDPIEQYDFWDTGAGGGHFVLNGAALGTNQHNYISAAQLQQTSYAAGSGADTLWVRVSEGGQWSPWSAPFTVSDPTTIGAGETLALSSAYSGQISFSADTGTLQLDHAASFAGTVAGMAGNDAIDFADIDPTNVETPSYSGNVSGGTLNVTDGTHTASIALLGNYLASIFVASGDGHGGINVVQHAPADTSTLVVQPQH